MMQIIRLLKTLNSDAAPSSIALAICLALFIGLTPVFSAHNLIIVLIALLFRIHLGTFILASFGFSLVGLAFEPLLERFGYFLLTNDAMTSFWTALYNTQLGRLSLFNYSTQLGGLCISLVAFVPLLLVLIWGIKSYRIRIKAWAEKSKLIVILRSSSLFQLYEKTGGAS